MSDERSESVVDPAYTGLMFQRLTEVASLRNGMHVLTAIAQRLGNSQGRMLEELRAMPRRQSRFGDRLRPLEEQHSPSNTRHCLSEGIEAGDQRFLNAVKMTSW